VSFKGEVFSGVKSAEDAVMPPKEVLDFTHWLGVLMRCGLPLFEAIERASQKLKNSRVKEAVGRIQECVKAGAPLSQALSGERSLFPPVYIAAIAQAEKTGNLPSALKSLANDFQDSIERQQMLRRIRLSPILTIAATFAIILAGLFVVLPIALIPARAFK